MMLGLIRPDEGSVRLFGRDPQLGVAALEGVAGFVEAPAFYPYLSGRKNLRLCAALDGGEAASRIDEVLEVVEMRERAEDRVGGYSHGMRQRLGLAAALLRRPRLLLLDEPATGLDPGGMRDMRELIRDLAAARDHRAALQPPAGRGRRALQPGRDRPPRQRRLRGRARRAARRAGVTYRLRTGADERARQRLRSRSAGSKTCAPPRPAGCCSAPPARPRSASSRWRWRSPGASVLELTPQQASLEDLFFQLTEGEGAAAAAAQIAAAAEELA